MVADSITNSELFHGSPISRDFSKKRKTNWFWKLKQWKIDARRRQWIYQWKKENVVEEENVCTLKSLREKLNDTKTGYFQAWKIDHEEGSYDDDDDDDDDETDLDNASSASSPTSVLKNKDFDSNKSGDDCFCCSKQLTEGEEEVFDDAFDNWDGFRDALNVFETKDNEGSSLHKTTTTGLKKQEGPIPKTSQRKKSNSKKLNFKPKASHGKNIKKKKYEQNQESDEEESECPICSHEMDATDLSFVPCPCGFQLCLFCHKKINENDGRCPACRNKYDQTSNNSGEVSFQQRGRGTVRLSPSFGELDRA